MILIDILLSAQDGFTEVAKEGVPIWLYVVTTLLIAIGGFWKKIEGFFLKVIANKKEIKLKKLDADQQEKLSDADRNKVLEAENLEYKLVYSALEALMPIMKKLTEEHKEYEFLLTNFENILKRLKK